MIEDQNQISTYFKNSVLISDHILKRNYIPCKLKYKNRYSYIQTYEIVSSFLNTINKEYYKEFHNKIKDNKIKILERNIIPIYDEKDESIKIPYTQTLQDSYNLIHELFHSLNFPQQKSQIHYKYTEFISILSEILLEEYLNQNHFDETYYESNNRLIWLNSISTSTLYLNDIYRNMRFNKKINNEKLYYEFIKKYNGANILPERTLEIINEPSFEIIDNCKYIVGITLAYKLKNNLNYDELEKMLIKLNDNINIYTEEEFYNEIGFKKSKDGVLDYRSLNDLYKSFDMECYNNFNKVYIKKR